MTTDEQGNEIGKLFVGGLHQSTNNESLKTYFGKYGEVLDASVMMDNKTGRSRGFGYVKFSDGDIVNKVMSLNKHVLDGKEIDPKPCNVNMKGKSRRSLKVFVGGIAPEHNEDTLREFFKQFGNLTELTLMKDPSGHRHRGFAFVGYDDEAVVKQLITDHYLTIGTKQVEIKPMEPQAGRNNNMDMSMAINMQGLKRNINMNPMQGQWPQWSAAPTGNPAAATPWSTSPAAGVMGGAQGAWSTVNAATATMWDPTLNPAASNWAAAAAMSGWATGNTPPSHHQTGGPPQAQQGHQGPPGSTPRGAHGDMLTHHQPNPATAGGWENPQHSLWGPPPPHPPHPHHGNHSNTSGSHANPGPNPAAAAPQSTGGTWATATMTPWDPTPQSHPAHHPHHQPPPTAATQQWHTQHNTQPPHDWRAINGVYHNSTQHQQQQQQQQPYKRC